MKSIFAVILVFCVGLFFSKKSSAQIDLNNIDLNDIIGRVMKVEKGFSPKFFLGNTPVQKVNKVAEILGLKKNETVNKLFKTFKTGRIVYKAAAYAGTAVIAYAVIRKIDNSVKSNDYSGALYTGIGSVASGVIVKLITKASAYKAVDIFNGIAAKKIRDIFSIAPASRTAGIGLYVKL